MANADLAGRAILVAEDEYFAAMDIKRELTRLGASVIGPAPSLETVLDLIEGASRVDGAILDVNLRGEMIFPAADRLRERGVPFVFATGYDHSMIPSRFEDVHRYEKPIGPDKLSRALVKFISQNACQP